MNRKEFLKTSGIGLGFALVPGIVLGKTTSTTSSGKPKIIKDGQGEVLNVIGDLQTHKLVGTETEGQITEWVDDVEPGTGIPPHVHTQEDEIFRVVKGEVEIRVGDSTTVLKAGDVAFAPKNIPHAWKVVGTEKARMITSAFPSGIEDMFQELAVLPAGPPDLVKVSDICRKYGIRFI
ncbi:cupin domain-containing protein [Croceiramulus getboli]|nr:cupin domain-containing protein [Flavobacteriaceae bacterium YJPT1-3]